MNEALLTQQELIAQKLTELKPEVTDQDKTDLTERENISKSTVYMYLNGRVLNIQTGITILTFLKKRVEDRRALIVKM